MKINKQFFFGSLFIASLTLLGSLFYFFHKTALTEQVSSQEVLMIVKDSAIKNICQKNMQSSICDTLMRACYDAWVNLDSQAEEQVARIVTQELGLSVEQIAHEFTITRALGRYMNNIMKQYPALTRDELFKQVYKIIFNEFFTLKYPE